MPQSDMQHQPESQAISSVRIPLALHRQIKIEAAQRGRTIAEILGEAASEWLERHASDGSVTEVAE